MASPNSGDWQTRCVCSLCKTYNTRIQNRRCFSKDTDREGERGGDSGCRLGPSLDSARNPAQDSQRIGGDEQKPTSARRRAGSVPETLLDSLLCGKDSRFAGERAQNRVHQRHLSAPVPTTVSQSSAVGVRSKPPTVPTRTVTRERYRSQGYVRRRKAAVDCRTKETTADDNVVCAEGRSHSNAFQPESDQTENSLRYQWSDFDDLDALDDALDVSTDCDRDERGGSPETACKSDLYTDDISCNNTPMMNQACTRRSSGDCQMDSMGRSGPSLSLGKQKHVDFIDTDDGGGDRVLADFDVRDKDETRFATNINENRRRRSLTTFHERKLQEAEDSPRRLSDPCLFHHTSRLGGDRITSSFIDPLSKKHGRVNATVNHSGRHRRTSGKLHSARAEPAESVVSSDNEGEEENRTGNVSSHNSAGLLAANLCDMWRRDRLCDAVLHAGGQEFPVHCLVLAAFSNTFASRYCESGTREAPLQLHLQDTTPDGLQQVLRFVYTGDISITPDNIRDVLGAASSLHINHVLALCKTVLHQPSVDTVIQYSQLADKFHLTDDPGFFYDFICEHFLSVTRTRAWRGLGFGQVFDFLSEDNLNVERELDVFHAAVAWIEADRSSRLTYAADLIGCVRFAFITPDEIAKHVETKHFLFHGSEGKELLLCIYRHHALQSCGCKHGQRLHKLPRRQYLSPGLHSRNKNASAFTRQRSSTSEACQPHRYFDGFLPAPPRPDVILAIGGVNPFKPEVETQVRQVEQFNPRSNHWTTLTRLPDGRHHHGAVVLGEAVYVIGGSVLDELNPGHLCNPTASCYRYQTTSGQWSAIAPLNVPRMYHATAALSGLIFVVTGQTHHSRHLSSVEFYRADVDEWESGGDVGEARIGVALAAYRGQLFAVGGFLETQREHVVRPTVEVYDHRARRWKARSPLSTPRCHACLAVCVGKLYLVGGSTFPRDSPAVCSLASVLRYDELDDRWDKIQTLRTPRHDMGVAVIGCRIFIVGGVSSTENQVLSDVECLDLDGDHWLDDVESLGSPALGIACVTVPGDE